MLLFFYLSLPFFLHINFVYFLTSTSTRKPAAINLLRFGAQFLIKYKLFYQFTEQKCSIQLHEHVHAHRHTQCNIPSGHFFHV